MGYEGEEWETSRQCFPTTNDLECHKRGAALQAMHWKGGDLVVERKPIGGAQECKGKIAHTSVLPTVIKGRGAQETHVLPNHFTMYMGIRHHIRHLNIYALSTCQLYLSRVRRVRGRKTLLE